VEIDSCCVVYCVDAKHLPNNVRTLYVCCCGWLRILSLLCAVLCIVHRGASVLVSAQQLLLHVNSMLRVKLKVKLACGIPTLCFVQCPVCSVCFHYILLTISAAECCLRVLLIRISHLLVSRFIIIVRILVWFLRCFNAVSWVAGRASWPLKNLEKFQRMCTLD